MSNTVATTTVTSGLKVVQDVGGTGLHGILLGNNSNLKANVNLQGAGVVRTLFPYTVDFFEIPNDGRGNYKTWSGNCIIQFDAGTPDNGSYVQIDTIGIGEPFKTIYPIALSRGNVNTTVASTNTLSNEANASQTLIIDVGQTGNTLLITINSDGSFVWKVLQSGVAHTILTGRIAGKPLLLGQGGDHVEVAGTLDVDQQLFVVGVTTLDNGAIVTNGSGAIQGNGQYGVSSVNDVLDASGFDTFLASRGAGNILHLRNATTDVMNFASGGATLKTGVLSLISGNNSHWGSASFSGTGTINHGCGAQPDIVMPSTHVNGSQTVGYDSENGTTVHITAGTGLGGIAYSIKYG